MNDKKQQEDDYGFFYDLEDYDYEKTYNKKNDPIKYVEKYDPNTNEDLKKAQHRLNGYLIISGALANAAIMYILWTSFTYQNHS